MTACSEFASGRRQRYCQELFCVLAASYMILNYNRDMTPQTQSFIEIVNRLRRGTSDGKVLWEHTGEYGQQFKAPLDNSHQALVAEAPGGSAVIFTMTNGHGVQTLYL